VGLGTIECAKLDECNVIIFGDSKQNSFASTQESKPKHKKKIQKHKKLAKIRSLCIT
jgi:hypothetical protein